MHPVVPFIWLLFCGVTEAAYEDARCKCTGFDRSSGPNGTIPAKKIYVKAVPADKCTCKNILGDDDILYPNCECKYQVRNTTTIKVVVCLILVIISALTLYMIFLLLLEPLLSARRASRGHIPVSGSGTGCEIDATGRTFSSGFVASGLAQLTRSHLPDWAIKRSWTQFTNPGLGCPKAAGVAVVWGRSRMNTEQLLNDEQPSSGTIPHESKLRQRVSKQETLFPIDSHSPGTSGNPPTVNVTNVVTRVKDQQQRWKGNVEAQRARVFNDHTLLN